jgi:hypothetical protein
MAYDHMALRAAFLSKFGTVNAMATKTDLHSSTIEKIIAGKPNVRESRLRLFAKEVELDFEKVSNVFLPKTAAPVTIMPIETMDFRPRLDPRCQIGKKRGRDLYLIVSFINITLLDDNSSGSISNFRLTCNDLKTLRGREFKGVRWASLSEQNTSEDNPIRLINGEEVGYWLATTNPTWSESGAVVTSVELDAQRPNILAEMGFASDVDKSGSVVSFDSIITELRHPKAPGLIRFTLKFDYQSTTIDREVYNSYVMSTIGMEVALNAYIQENDSSPNRFKLVRAP